MAGYLIAAVLGLLAGVYAGIALERKNRCRRCTARTTHQQVRTARRERLGDLRGITEEELEEAIRKVVEEGEAQWGDEE